MVKVSPESQALGTVSGSSSHHSEALLMDLTALEQCLVTRSSTRAVLIGRGNWDIKSTAPAGRPGAVFSSYIDRLQVLLMVEVYKYSEKQVLARKVGEFIVECQERALAADGNSTFTVAISGGSLVNVLRASLVDDDELSAKVKWSKWQIYFCDERLVPLDDPQSNYGAFKTAVLDPLSHHGDHLNLGPTVYAINEALVQQGSHQNEKIAEEYASLLPAAGFDLLLLGCGPDGHTCSLFPGDAHRYLLEETSKTVAWCRDSPKPPSDRITFTLPVIARSRNIAFVAEGSSKQQIMHKIFDDRNVSLPTALINASYGEKVRWYVDDDAFARVADSSVLANR
ncbi:hypothetical protein HG536_0A01000 [Torulaspora globosa]|uniref:6-phosphogluconolactonase n=1 Tax=Torulaspora globosa TaxID=48254 RepID=A0A7G3Z9U7_9SACH|nr:uncharacterized protein HG536_0A01000 [Torulaspora globosa]QLL30283.1 hypothetical protein HG536_0A01000 [Torulaspora globosa]